jgi:hypothetical protein
MHAKFPLMDLSRTRGDRRTIKKLGKNFPDGTEKLQQEWHMIWYGTTVTKLTVVHSKAAGKLELCKGSQKRPGHLKWARLKDRARAAPCRFLVGLVPKIMTPLSYSSSFSDLLSPPTKKHASSRIFFNYGASAKLQQPKAGS